MVEQRRNQRTWRRRYLTWAWFTRIFALTGVATEAFGHVRFGRSVDATLLALYATMLGLPSAVMLDYKMRQKSRPPRKAPKQTSKPQREQD